MLLINLLLALSLMNYGFARWSGSLDVKPSVQTSRVSWGFDRNLLEQIDKGPDPSCQEGKDVSSTVCIWGDTDSDDVPDRLELDVSNAYPGYYNKITCGIKNFGQVPINVDKTVLNWEGEAHTLEEGHLYYLCSGGGIARGSIPEDKDALIEVRWSGVEKPFQGAGELFEGQLEFHLLPDVSQNSKYNFSIAVAATVDDDPGGTDQEPGGPGDSEEPGEPQAPPGEDDELIDVPEEPGVVGPPAGPPSAGEQPEPVTPPGEGKPASPPVKGEFPLTGGNVFAVVYTGMLLIGAGVLLLGRRDGKR